jgi:ribose transport system permease protein
MSGVNNAMIKASGFIICGLFSGLAATFTLAYQGAVSLTTGTGMEFQAIAACVVGGLVLGGGQGDSIGAFIGALFLTLVMNGLYKYGISTAWQYIFQGGIILFATAFDAQFNKLTERRLRVASNVSNT